ncbi:MAG: prepilin-type N-terminal cleavage/methylation domain-containing protein [Candidatus Sumerlaeia bacterium]|nr:prepilin-type N-terminal cleavage/methylation domain-containing protein [Candidatus Sumerlaeia bacterium]
MNGSNFSRAFTLIELLIVVAIIAILAAIAVPNFLEAQVRSKVSRTKADMRTVATALEAYYVDANRYPPDFTHVIKPGGAAVVTNPIYRNYNTMIGRLGHLTTPIAYLTSLPDDVFATKLAASSGVTRYNGAPLSTAPYREGGVITGAITRPIVYDYATYDRDLIGTGESAAAWQNISSSPETVAWALNSPGPDVTVHEYLGIANFTVYDPTNGTISIGQIIRTNIGVNDMRN